ncbi:hypothetical protein FF38_01012 [Lucilia cuprina]|uniref:Uncharacterized protein n=1 Tax=Lucilia cuprina TaxID=7375 RepID=A0A0L0BXG6_LUCCU|nr:hypothetical protein FF38_01012 [Lucilia cuprina]
MLTSDEKWRQLYDSITTLNKMQHSKEKIRKELRVVVPNAEEALTIPAKLPVPHQKRDKRIEIMKMATLNSG